MKNVFGKEIEQDPLDVAKDAAVDAMEVHPSAPIPLQHPKNRQIRAVVSTDINGKCNALCNICHGPLAKWDTFYDCATRQGPWGWLCLECFQRFGKGIGTGMGQEYDSNTLIKLRG